MQNEVSTSKYKRAMYLLPCLITVLVAASVVVVDVLLEDEEGSGRALFGS